MKIYEIAYGNEETVRLNADLATVEHPQMFAGWLVQQVLRRFAGRQLNQRTRDLMQMFVAMVCDLAHRRWSLPDGHFVFDVVLRDDLMANKTGWPRPHGITVDGGNVYLYAISPGACESVDRFTMTANSTSTVRAQQWDSPVVRPLDEWCHDDGDVLWWRFPVSEPPYVGTPGDDDFPSYVTHWTRIVVPGSPPAHTPPPPRFELVFTLAVELGKVELWPDGDMPTDPTPEDVERLVAKDGGPGAVLDRWDLLHANANKVTMRVTKAGHR